jgi:hypothetical protein
MRSNLFFPVGIFLGGALLASSACSFKLNVPPGQVLCKLDSDCPSGAVCETINQDAAPIPVRVCCLKPGCTANLSPDTISAAIAAAYQPPDASSSEVSASPEVSVSSEAGNAEDALVGPETQISWDSGVGPEAQTSLDVQTLPDAIVVPDALASPDVFVFLDATVSQPDASFGPEAQIAFDVSPPAPEVGPKMDVVNRDVAFLDTPIANDGPLGADKAGDGPGTDKATGGPGATCASDSECSTGHCAVRDHVCCNSACTGLCTSCKAEYTGGTSGTCAQTSNLNDPYDDCTADIPASGCGHNGYCDGAGACAFYDSATVCRLASCDITNTYYGALSCDGKGGCFNLKGKHCGNYACNLSGCPTTCSTNSDCVQPTYHCDLLLGCICAPTSCPPGQACNGTTCEPNDAGTVD